MFRCVSDLVPVGLLVELVRALHQYRRAGQGLNTSKLEFFKSLFLQLLLSCILKNCDGLLYIYFFIPQFKYMKFMYSSPSSLGNITNQFIDQPPVGLLAQSW